MKSHRRDCSKIATPSARAQAKPGAGSGSGQPPSVQSVVGEAPLPRLTWEEAFRLYEDHMRARRLSPGTIKCQHADLSRLRAELAPEAPGPAQVELPQLRRYQLGLFRRRLAASTVARITSHVRAFFEFLFLEELLPTNPAERLEHPKVPPRPPGDVLTPQDVTHLLRSAKEGKTPLLDRAILEVLYCTGVRRAELVAIDVFDVDHRERTLLVRAGKGEKPRVLPLTPTCYDALLHYLEHARPELERAPTPALFLNTRGQRLKPGGLGHRLHKLAARAGLTKRVTPHCFRRSCATGLLKNGTNLKVIQAILGHSSLETTSVYLALSPEDIRNEVLGKHPRERFEA